VSGIVVAKRMRASASKATPITVRLAPDLQRAMELLRDVLKRPVNKMINEAVQGFVQKRTAEVETDLKGILSQIKAYKRRDPHFDVAFDQWADAEARFGGEDPAEGVVVKTETVEPKAKAGPAQTLVRDLLSR
jgi:predicted transcriptional regulator